MSGTVKRRNLRANANKVKAPKAAKMCPEHNKVMRFDQITNTWQCPVEECDKRLYPKADADKFGKPTIVDARGDTGVPVLCVIYEPDSKESPITTGATFGIRFPSSNTIVVLPNSVVKELDKGDPGISTNVTYRLSLEFNQLAVYKAE